MIDNIAERLDAVFDRHESAKQAAEDARIAKECEEQKFVRSFVDARDRIIEPAMKEIGEHLRAKGYDYSIEKYDDGVSEDGRSHRASIYMKLYLGTEGAFGRSAPSFSVYCIKKSKSIGFHGSTITIDRGGHTGPAGTPLGLSDLTTEIIQEKLLRTISEVLQ